MNELCALVRPFGASKSRVVYARYESCEVSVYTRGYWYYEREVSGDVLTLRWNKHRPGWLPWGEIVGFTIYCPPTLGLRGRVGVEVVLSAVDRAWPGRLNVYRQTLFELGTGVPVNLPLAESGF